MSAAGRLRELIAAPGPIATTGVYDCLSARVVEAAGFPAMAVSGAGVTASALGRPDLGLLTMTEMLERVQRIVECVDIPVMADCETGYGGVLNVMRTVSAFEKAGVAGLMIEDQVAERKCGHFRGKGVISTEDMVMKVRAAVKARSDPDLLLLARTDARAIEGIDGALSRARAYAEAGADSLLVEAPQSDEELWQITTQLADLGLPIKVSLAEGGKSPMHTVAELTEMGYKFINFPGGPQKVAIKAMSAFLESVQRTGGISEFYPDRMTTLDERSALLDLDHYYQIEEELKL